MSKVFVIDIDRCNGCRNCQLVCKDEHCNQAWLPYSEAQPMTGQFWMNVNEKTRGRVPVVKVSYIPVIGAQNEAIREYAPEVLQEREDGLIVIDPVKAAGRKDLVEKFEGVYWNEKLQLPQGCAGCAHLLDDGWTVPRCVDACCTDALLFGEESEFDLSDAVQLEPGSKVYYRNYPKRFIAGSLYDSKAEEVIIGASVKLISDGQVIAEAETDDFGDFKFDQIEAGVYEIKASWGGAEKCVEANVEIEDCVLDDIDMTA